ncbi:MAG: 2,3-bisphosphoglycerate-dependent phosphoglycerate mutase [Candidatus Levybacteria bacterium GW2011_GWC2_37_7]|nr:MAG: 2,3-bisphosphoglycerate-dependent phosphoglycerate mutase [Candidatus Levybacteria bacterium GW2011_GWC2_37_7]
MAYLILVRHGESEWNEKGLWTGLADIGLTEKGKEEARLAGEKLKVLPVDFAFTSQLIRAKQTLDEVKNVLGIDVPTFEDKALNERDYGIYTGKNKWEIQKEVGEEQFQKIRRGWDVPIQNGESLKDVYNRVIPYYQSEILPKLKDGKNILIVAHGNSLRALTKYLENISDKNISKLEIEIGEVNVFEIDNNENIITKKIL